MAPSGWLVGPAVQETPRKFFCLRAAFGESYKNRSLHLGYLVKREYVLNNKSKHTLMFAPESKTRWRCGGGGDTGGSKTALISVSDPTALHDHEYRKSLVVCCLMQQGCTDVERISGDTDKNQYIARKKLSVCQAGVHLKSSHSQYEHLQSLQVQIYKICGVAPLT